MGKVLLFLGMYFVGSLAVSPPCPGLPSTEGMEISCMHPTNSSTVDCSSSNVPRGTVAQYKCQNGDTGTEEEKTLVCICKGRWRGIPKFNEVAEGCGGTKLSLALGNASYTLASQTDNSAPGRLLDQASEGNETISGPPVTSSAENQTTNGTITPMSALMMPLLPVNGNQATVYNQNMNGGVICNCTQVANSSTTNNGTQGRSDEPGPAYNVVIDYDDDGSAPSSNSTNATSVTIEISPVITTTVPPTNKQNYADAEPGPVYNVLHEEFGPNQAKNETTMPEQNGSSLTYANNVTSSASNTTSASATSDMGTIITTTPTGDAELSTEASSATENRNPMGSAETVSSATSELVSSTPSQAMSSSSSSADSITASTSILSSSDLTSSTPPSSSDLSSSTTPSDQSSSTQSMPSDLSSSTTPSDQSSSTQSMPSDLSSSTPSPSSDLSSSTSSPSSDVSSSTPSSYSDLSSSMSSSSSETSSSSLSSSSSTPMSYSDLSSSTQSSSTDLSSSTPSSSSETSSSPISSSSDASSSTPSSDSDLSSSGSSSSSEISSSTPSSFPDLSSTASSVSSSSILSSQTFDTSSSSTVSFGLSSSSSSSLDMSATSLPTTPPPVSSSTLTLYTDSSSSTSSPDLNSSDISTSASSDSSSSTQSSVINSSSQSSNLNSSSYAPLPETSSSNSSSPDVVRPISIVGYSTTASSLLSSEGSSSPDSGISSSTESLISLNGTSTTTATNNDEPRVASEGPGQVPTEQTTSFPIEYGSDRESKNLNLGTAEENQSNPIASSTEGTPVVGETPSSTSTEQSNLTEPSASSGGELKIISPNVNQTSSETLQSSTPSQEESSTQFLSSSSSTQSPVDVRSGLESSSTENSSASVTTSVVSSSTASSSDSGMGLTTQSSESSISASTSPRPPAPIGLIITSPPLESNSLPPTASSNVISSGGMSSSTDGQGSTSPTPEESNSTPQSNESSTTESSSSTSGMVSEASNMSSSTQSPSEVSENTEVPINATDFQLKALELHNALRQQHQSQPLKLNETLNQIAQDWAEQEISRSSLRVTPGKRAYAQNMYRASGGPPLTKPEAAELAFKSWNSSAKYFDYQNPKPTAFSQMVWNKTTQLGVGVAQLGSKSIVVATYYPRGNVVLVEKNSTADPGYFFKQNVFPPLDTESSSENSFVASSSTVSPTSIGMTEEATTSPPLFSASLKLSVGGENHTASIGASTD